MARISLFVRPSALPGSLASSERCKTFRTPQLRESSIAVKSLTSKVFKRYFTVFAIFNEIQVSYRPLKLIDQLAIDVKAASIINLVDPPLSARATFANCFPSIPIIHYSSSPFVSLCMSILPVFLNRVDNSHRIVLTNPLDYSILIVVTPDRLKTWRRNHGYTQVMLAEALGVIPLTVSRWERGVREIPSFLGLALEALECKGGDKVIRSQGTWKRKRKRR